MDDLMRETLFEASVFARRQRDACGEDWYARFQSALRDQDLDTVHDLILSGLRASRGIEATRRLLREVDEELAAASRGTQRLQ